MGPDGLRTIDERNQAPSVPHGFIVQRLLLDRSTTIRQLYWRALIDGTESLDGVRPDGAGGLLIADVATLSFDTYFGAVFEPAWRLYTCLGPLTLSLDLQGRAMLRIWRRLPGCPRALLLESELTGPARLTLPQDATHHRQAGLLWFELTAIGGSAILGSAAWTTPTLPAVSARLGVVICTFNRELPLADVLGAIAGDPGLDEAIARVIVVNQGRAGLVAHPALAAAVARLGDRLAVIEQPNFGGAGGFGRGLIEAQDDPAVTHACLLDDDVRLEPESLRRMAAFFTLANNEGGVGPAPLALGGHMLDGIHATTLYEAGATIQHNWVLQPINHGLELREPDLLLSLLEVEPMHFNGWWMFGFDKRLIDQVGMPLPCFIRGDDVEFGLRLHDRGIATIALPGVAIWHEPFYLKIGGWQLYYEVRNALIAAALHQDFSRRHVAGQVMKRLLIHLLTYRYYNGALIVRAVEDFLQGPAILDRDPRPLHASLAALRTRFPETSTRREQVLPAAPVGHSPRWRAAFMLALLRAVWGNYTRPSAASAPLRRLLVRDLVWFRVMQSDALAVDTYWDRDLPTFRRDRAAFRGLLVEGVRAAWRLWRAAPDQRRDWQVAAPRLTSVAFWREYLARR